MQQNYDNLIERIASAAGLGVEEVNRKVEAKKAKLSGLISREGAAQIVAAELGISLDKQNIKINQIIPGMRRINLIAKIIQLFPVREYKKESRSGKVATMMLADETGNIRCVMWDINHIALIENKQIKEGDVVEIANANFRNYEIHLTGFSDIKKSAEQLDNVKTEIVLPLKKISDLKVGAKAKVRAVVVQIFEPRYFEVCPECNKKVAKTVEGSNCAEHGNVVGKKRAVLTVVLDDGSESIRSVLFSEQIEKFGFGDDVINELDLFLEKRQEYLGKEALFSGSVRQNKFFNNAELIVSDIEEVNLDNLIKELEEKIKVKS